jgi:hypothetical protein
MSTSKLSVAIRLRASVTLAAATTSNPLRSSVKLRRSTVTTALLYCALTRMFQAGLTRVRPFYVPDTKKTRRTSRLRQRQAETPLVDPKIASHWLAVPCGPSLSLGYAGTTISRNLLAIYLLPGLPRRSARRLGHQLVGYFRHSLGILPIRAYIHSLPARLLVK